MLTVEPQDTQGTEYPLEEEIFLGRDEECTLQSRLLYLTQTCSDFPRREYSVS